MAAVPSAVQTAAQPALRAGIQKVATGPEYSKDLSYEEAYAAMAEILSGNADPVQTAVFLIALRMKRETDAENKGVLQAIRDSVQQIQAPVDEVFDVGDPYDGHARGLPMAAFLPAVLASLGIPAVCHGLESVGPKYGVTHRKILQHLNIPLDMSPAEAAKQLGQTELGWTYIDQKAFAPQLHQLVNLRARMVKRQVLTTVEVLVGPIRGRRKTHLLTGYVHKAYPPIYSELARFSGFDSAIVVRGVEGGVIPSLQQPAKLYRYHDRQSEIEHEINPKELGIEQATRAVPIPKDIAKAASQADAITNAYDVEAAAARSAEVGLAALQGQAGPARDALIYSAAICLHHLGRSPDLRSAADQVRLSLDSGRALTHFNHARNP